MTPTGREVFEKFKAHLEAHDIKFDTRDEDLLITLTVTGEDLPQPTAIRILDERNIVQVLSPIPGNIPEDKRVDAAVAVSVANYRMINGAFDLDMSDGEIRFRIAQSYLGMEINDDFLKYILGVTFITTDKYNDRFFMLGKGMMTLEQFIEKLYGPVDC